MFFRKIDDPEYFEITSYIHNYLNSYAGKEFNIYVGCDSQNHAYETKYATTVILHTPNGGSHILYKKEKFSMIFDINYRLWIEVEKSIQAANYLKQKNIDITAVHLDFNTKPEHYSNNIVNSAVGFVQGMGYNVKCKPDTLCAVYAADHIVN